MVLPRMLLITAVGLGSTAVLAGPRSGGYPGVFGLPLAGAGASDGTLAAAVGRAMRLPSRFAPPARMVDRELAVLSNRSSGLESVPAERVLSPSAQFVRRVQREGLPLARLWQSKSALLSIGLNAKGKPGLWLTQKIP